MQTFKTGDWCFCEFKLQQIMNMEDGRVVEVSDGRFRMSGHNLTDRCFPLDLKIKSISNTVEHYMDKLHEISSPNLNYPDLNRALIQRWIDLCLLKDDDKAISKGYEELSKFYWSIVEKVNDAKETYVEGVQIFR